MPLTTRPPAEPQAHGVDVEAEIRLGDALLAALWPTRGRAMRFGICWLAVGCGAWLGPEWFRWALYSWTAWFVGLHGAAAWLVRRDYQAAGGVPRRLRYHVCGEGIEIRDAGRRSEWLPWEEVEGARETPASFVVRASATDQYVIPKRDCRGGRTGQLRRALAGRP